MLRPSWGQNDSVKVQNLNVQLNMYIEWLHLAITFTSKMNGVCFHTLCLYTHKMATYRSQDVKANNQTQLIQHLKVQQLYPE